jgi:hypothetical protein
MPLSPADVTYINRLLDRHLKHQRSWPRVRFFQLAAAALFIVMGLWGTFSSYAIVRQMLQVPPTASRPANAGSTLPVTYGILRMAQETTEIQARVDSFIFTAVWSNALIGIFFVFLGTSLAGMTLRKWNDHRRDAILITLLREKCAAELAPPVAT